MIPLPGALAESEPEPAPVEATEPDTPEDTPKAEAADGGGASPDAALAVLAELTGDTP